MRSQFSAADRADARKTGNEILTELLLTSWPYVLGAFIAGYFSIQGSPLLVAVVAGILYTTHPEYGAVFLLGAFLPCLFWVKNRDYRKVVLPREALNALGRDLVFTQHTIDGECLWVVVSEGDKT